jgi:hypothetical protein
MGNGALLASAEATKHTPCSNPKHAEIALQLFRLWAAHPAVRQGVSANNPSNGDSFGPAPRALVWTAYYRFLTAVLQSGLTYTGPNDGPDRPQLCSELRRVETIYERNLLSEVMFPTASSQNSQVEEWVEQVISNWQVLCGPEWQDSDLGEGGQNAVGRNVLEVSPTTDVIKSHVLKLVVLDSVPGSGKDLSLSFDTPTSLPRPFCLGRLRPCCQGPRFLHRDCHCSQRKGREIC